MYKKSFDIRKYDRIFSRQTKLLVFDMAGTTVDEHGIVYRTLYETLKNYGLDVMEKDIENWHGANKYHALEHFLRNSIETKNITPEAYENEKKALNRQFDTNLKGQYFENSSISLIDDSMPDLFNEIRENGIKIALNTGYSNEVQETIINRLHMNEFIDGYISSEDVKFGRPYPYMIFRLMEQFEIKRPTEVIKIGDTVNDILEGKNASCLTIGVLSGADHRLKLKHSDYLLDSVMNLSYVK